MNTIRAFVARHIIADVPPELDKCEGCRRCDCTPEEREACLQQWQLDGRRGTP